MQHLLGPSNSIRTLKLSFHINRSGSQRNSNLLLPRHPFSTLLPPIGVPDTSENLYRFLLGRVRAKLHVILCQSPVGAQFARRAQQFPGLINGCTIDWFLPWPQQALISVASRAVDGLAMACDDKVGHTTDADL
jgi:hypothetical protein